MSARPRRLSRPRRHHHRGHRLLSARPRCGTTAARRRRRPSAGSTAPASPPIVVTNQSGIARGLLDEAGVQRGRSPARDRCSRPGAPGWTAHYHCPHHPDFTGPCECRKPGPLLYRRAAADLGLDLARSWWVGDRERDVVPAEHFGGPWLVLIGGEPRRRRARPFRRGRHRYWTSCSERQPRCRLPRRPTRSITFSRP